MNENVWLQKLSEGFDDVKERLIRIEVQVQDVRKMQEELTVLGKEVANIESSTKSAHKRLDKLEADDKQKEEDIRWLKRAVITGLISVLGTVIVAFAKGWI